ncbi:energy transducer TonB [Endozoicomonas sp. GU-1]|uniref:energy transducer TonB n=1 Tax=Endozoicomonas sp. GU-1 TaxID=3009078 RepID=UPI0022B32E45|nr:energy transducer TonB [Endozoicomonas sp. GU-1]WBA79673.1 energy transducer TonB [Endozoicomonas sp. GU-1]
MFHQQVTLPGNGLLNPSPRFFARILAALIASFIALLMFLGMKALISPSESHLNRPSARDMLDFVRVKTVEKTVAKKQQAAPPEAPVIPPSPPMPAFTSELPALEHIPLPSPTVAPGIAMNDLGFNLGAMEEADYLPIVKVAPVYPERALNRGIEGQCTVEYTVNRDGSVRDVVVIESLCDSWLFHRPSVQAAIRFRYQPRMVDGQAVEVFGLRNQFTYRIQ